MTAGVASLAVRDLLRGTRRHGKVLAALAQAIYLEFADTVPEPRVLAVSPPDAIRLPNAIITGPWEARPPGRPADAAECWAGEGRVTACGLDIRIVRWWDPSPVFGPVSRARLDHGSGALARLYAAAEHAPGLAGHDGPGQLAACCAAATWPAPSRRPSTWWASAPAWYPAATAWSAACCSRSGCWRRARASISPGVWWQAAARRCFCPYPDPVIVPLTGLQYEIEAGPYRATVTELGAGLRELAYRGQPVIAGHEPDELPPAGAGQLLAPWPNRIDGGRYVFGGTEYQLALTEPARANAIHGLTRWKAWTAVSQDSSVVRLRSAPHGQQGYPFCLEIEAEYRLDPGTGLQVAVTARNRGSHAAPYGTGSHPYLTVRTPSVDGCDLTLPAEFWLPMDDRGIPSGPPEPVEGTEYDFRRARAIGGTRLDHALTGLSRDGDGRAWAFLAAGGGAGPRVGLWADEGYRWLQVFTGDPLGPDRRRKAVAIEPMTCPPNAFVTADDLLVLEPGEKVTHTWGIQAF